MSERERWVVYPLLFLALGASLRDKLGGRLTAKSIVCQELRIEDEPIGNQPAQVLAMIGRLQANPNAPALGGLVVNGEIAVEGAVKVDGVVNVSKYFAIQGNPIFPIFQVTPRNASPVRPAPGSRRATATPENKSGTPSDDSSKESRPTDKAADNAATQN
jgi:hypothetical protein